MKYFKTYITYIYILLSSVESSFLTPYTCLTFQEKYIQNALKHVRWRDFACPVNDFKPLNVYAKTIILDGWRGSEYACIQIASENVLCHLNKRLMEYIEFLYSSVIIFFPLNIPEKFLWQYIFKKPEKAGTCRLYLS